MFPITGTGSKDKALYSEQHKSPGSIAESPFFTSEVPSDLLRDCEKKRKDALVSAVRKATNLYRRVSTVNYKNVSKVTCKKRKHNSSKCLVCLVTLVKSSKDRQRAGVKLRCPCNVRVCSTCFANNPQWYLTTPHLTKCPTLPSFICSVCFVFQGVKEKVCCVWMCPRCSSEQRNGSCSKCSRDLGHNERRETRVLWCPSKTFLDSQRDDEVVCDNENVERYRNEIRVRVLEKVSNSRHLSAANLRTLFRECFAPQACRCEGDQNPLCVSCTPVLTIMELLAKNPQPLMASLAERAIPGRALARHVYDRALLLKMLNDHELPLCVNGHSCKGMLLLAQNPRPLTSLVSPECYNRFVSSKVKKSEEVQQVTECCCIVCLLFNQSAAITQMLSSDSLYLEPHPSGPVYYFNIKLSPDLGVPEVSVDGYQGYLVQFQGAVGSYKPTFYYNWRDMLSVLHVDHSGKVTISPSE